MRLSTLPAALAAFVIATGSLSACSVVDSVGGGAASPTTVDPQATKAPEPGLQRFYDQKIAWSRCDGGQCGTLTVPVDYAKPAGETIAVSVLKVPASRGKARIGSLVVNPGGPGGSGVDYAKSADYIVGASVRQRFDVVGFDPRGVKRSAPVTCVDASGLDTFLGGVDQTPDTPAEETAWAKESKTFADGCQARNPSTIGHVSTVDAAKDMDVLRAALGESTLAYLGKSYGTFLGATYADLFPKRVGRMVLDGVIAPDLTAEEINLGQAKGFETATAAWARDCVGEGDCPLGTSEQQVLTGLRSFLAGLDAAPLRVDRAATGAGELTEAWGSMGVAMGMYDQGAWSTLTDALRQAVRAKNGTALMEMANQYAERSPRGTYGSNIMQVIYAVNCLDKPDTADLAEYRARADAAAKVAPTWGRMLEWSSVPCSEWPVPASGKPHTISATGADPIVVIGTTRDPATPYEWAVRLRKQLDKASLITFDGDGHTAYTRSNDCVDGAVNDYYVKGTVPQDGLRC